MLTVEAAALLFFIGLVAGVFIVTALFVDKIQDLRRTATNWKMAACVWRDAHVEATTTNKDRPLRCAEVELGGYLAEAELTARGWIVLRITGADFSVRLFEALLCGAPRLNLVEFELAAGDTCPACHDVVSEARRAEHAAHYTQARVRGMR